MKSILTNNEIEEYSIDDINHKKVDNNENDIAIIGMGVKMPLADDITEFWDNIKNGIDCVRKFPKKRADKLKTFLSKKKLDKLNYMECSYLDSIDKFDYKYFNLTPKDAELMSPIHKVFLETVIETLDSAGYLGEEIKGSNTGIFLGAIGDVNFHSYKEIIEEVNPEQLSLSVTGTMASMMNGLLAYLLDLKGPAVTIDTACSSSLVAVHNACSSLKNEECDMAIVCGSRLHLVPLDDKRYKIGIESSDGITRTFDQTSDGSGYGEGVGVILLKPLKKAVRDGDMIHAVIKGSAVNQDGTSLGLTAPNPKSQEKVITDAWERAKINPEKISYIECHGTGTKLGDPIEIDALTKAFNRFTNKKQFCAVGSLKSNIGHLLDCSGIAGLIKVVLSMENNYIPPTINISTPNKSIDFLNSAVYVNAKGKEWKEENKLCGVSSFGISGVNCHMVLESAKAAERVHNVKKEDKIFVLSAKSEKSLIETVKSYVEYLSDFNEEYYADMCYTTNVGKMHFNNYRIAVIADSAVVLREKLSVLCKNSLKDIKSEQNIWIGYEGKEEESLDYSKDYSNEELCELYVNGADISWRKIYKNSFMKKIKVPYYVFDNTESWITSSNKPVSEKQSYDSMFYKVCYKEFNESGLNNEISRDDLLVISDDNEQNKALVNSLKLKGNNIYEVNVSDKYDKYDDFRYSTDLSKESCSKLFEDVQIENVKTIIYSVYASSDIGSIDNLKGEVNRGLIGLFNLAQCFAEKHVKSHIDLILITDSAYKVTSDESVIKPSNASIVGFGKNINIEFSNIKCRVIDKTENTTIDEVIEDIYSSNTNYFTALRNSKKYLEEFTGVDMKKVDEDKIMLKESGVYIITGGIGHIGLNIADYIAHKAKSQFILVSRRDFPERDQWDQLLEKAEDEKLCLTINKLRNIEALGSTVYIYKADISDEESVKNLISKVKENYMAINGVVHAAGITGNGYIATRKVEDFNTVINPKVYGTWLLDKYTADEQLDFFMMCSSGVGMIGEVGLADYTAANSYLDSFSSKDRKYGKYVAVDWVVWKNARMGSGTSKHVDGIFKQLDSNDAVECLDIVMNKKINRVLVGEVDYNSSLLKYVDKLPISLSEDILDKMNDTEEVIEDIINLSSKEVLLEGKDEYSEIEKRLSSIVGEVLGYEKINVYDNFFELGSNSILLSHIANEIDKAYPDKIMVSDLFAYPSVHKLAMFISGEDAEDADNNVIQKSPQSNLDVESEIDQLIDKLEGSDDIESVLNGLISL